MNAKRMREWLPPRVRSLLFRRQADQELAEEFEYHLEMRSHEYIDRGMNPEEARCAAMRAMGGMEQCKEECRDARGWRWMNEFLRDLLYGFRILAKSPGFTAITVLMLALGIGANTAVVSVLDTLIFRPLPFGRVDRLVGMPPGANYVNYLDIRAEAQVFSAVAATMDLPVSARASDGKMLLGRAVSANFFQVVGLPMTLGRGFLPGEDKISGSPPVAIVSYRFWAQNYRSDPAIVGKPIELNREPFTIVGVAPKDLPGDLRVGGAFFDLWVPIPMLARIAGLENTPMWRDAIVSRTLYPFLELVGRLKPGVTIEQARSRMTALISNLQKTYPGSIKEEEKPLLVPMSETRWPRRDLLFIPIVLMVAGICVLLITCTDIANLLVARGSARQREIATRLALGASRARVVRQLLAEGFALSVLALVLSLIMYRFVLLLFYAFNPFGDPLYANLGIDHRTLAFAIVIGLLSNLMFGLAPALAATRSEISGALKDQGFLGFGRRKARWRRKLVVSQIVLTVVLLVGAGLFGRTVRHFLYGDPGFDMNVQIFNQGEDKYQPDRARKMVFYRRALEQLRGLPGVRSAAWGIDQPFEPLRFMAEQIRPEGAASGNDNWLTIPGNSVSAGFFRTLSIPIIQGRDFAESDSQNPAGMVIVNETLARRFWPGMNPLGKRIRIRKAGPDEFRSQGPEICEVIGVVRGVKYKAPWEEEKPYVYFPYWHWFFDSMGLYVSVQQNPNAMAGSIRKLCETIDPGIKITSASSIAAQLKPLLSQERSAAFLFGIFGLLGLVLASIGLYGIISYSVAQRTREFGIRIALGAQAKLIVGSVILEGIKMVLMGLAIGLLASISLSRLVASRLHGLNPLDPITYAAIAILLIVVALLAAFLPARRAAANPMNALRTE